VREERVEAGRRLLEPKNPRPREIVFPEDEVRRLFFLDHPFEAYRAVTLVEGEKVAMQLLSCRRVRVADHWN
jgi:hypothetical protein